MNDDTLDDLIQRTLDGTATAAQRAELDAALAASDVARRRHAAQAEVFRALASARLADPPASLRDDVLRDVRLRAAKSGSRTPAAADQGLFARFLLPFASGAAVCALLWVAAGTRPVSPPQNVVGAIGSDVSVVPLLSLGAAERRVSLFARRGERGATVLEVRSSDAPARVWVAGDEHAVELTDVTRPTDGATKASVLPGVVVAELGPRAALAVNCSAIADPSEVRVTARLSDGSVSEGTIRLEWLPWHRRKR